MWSGLEKTSKFVEGFLLIEPTAVSFAIGRLGNASPANACNEAYDDESFDNPNRCERNAADSRVIAKKAADFPGAVFV